MNWMWRVREREGITWHQELCPKQLEERSRHLLRPGARLRREIRNRGARAPCLPLHLTCGSAVFIFSHWGRLPARPRGNGICSLFYALDLGSPTRRPDYDPQPMHIFESHPYQRSITDTVFHSLLPISLLALRLDSRETDVTGLPDKPTGARWLWKLGTCITFIEWKLSLKILHKDIANKGELRCKLISRQLKRASFLSAHTVCRSLQITAKSMTEPRPFLFHLSLSG